MSRSETKTLLITGASRGIGRALVTQSAQQGAHVIAVARKPDPLLVSETGNTTWVIADLATATATSVRSLQRDLRQNGGGFSGMLRKVRIDAAGRMLRDSKTPLAEVGYCCGYADQPHFQRDFRRMVNMSPGAYRRIATG